MDKFHHIYYQDSDASHLKTSIIDYGKDQCGSYFIPDQTIFHPEEDGQAADRGIVTIDGSHFPVTALAIDPNRTVKHYLPLSFRSDLKGKKIELTIDLIHRRRLMRWHTAGHLIGSLVEYHYPDLVISEENHFPGQAKLAFKPKKEGTAIRYHPQEIKALLKKEVPAMIAQPRSIIIDHTASVRTVQIQGLKCYPCKGIHIKTTAALQFIAIAAVQKIKDHKITISYSIAKLI